MTAGSEFLSPPLALFGTINGFELLVVVAAALMVFGSRLPEVALRAVAHVMRARRAVSKMWRDTGLEDELRRVRRDIELNIPRAADFDVTNPSPPAVIDEHDDHLHEDAFDPDEARANEYYESSVDIRPAEGIIASGEWSTDDDVDRREPIDGGAPEEGADEPVAGSPEAASEEPGDLAADVEPSEGDGAGEDPSRRVS